MIEEHAGRRREDDGMATGDEWSDCGVGDGTCKEVTRWQLQYWCWQESHRV